jgi:hypothetical protein
MLDAGAQPEHAVLNLGQAGYHRGSRRCEFG